MLIDFHYHLADTASALDDLLHDMDASGVEKTLLMGLDGKAYWDYMKCGFASNEKVRDAVKAHPDRLLGNLYVDPRNPLDAGDVRAVHGHRLSVREDVPPGGFRSQRRAVFPAV